MQGQYPQPQEDNRFERTTLTGKLLRLLEVVQLVLILVYCALSKSIESTVALVCLLACVALALNKRYVYDKKREVLLGNFVGESLRPLQTRRILWGVFLTFQLIFVIFKAVYFATGVIHLNRYMQQALEVQSPVYAFVPCIFLATTPALLLVKHRRKPLEEFKQPLSRLVVVVMHSLLIILLVVLQFLNLSVLSLGQILIVAGLNMGKPWSFSRKRWLVIATVLFTAGWIVGIFICSMDVVELGVIAGNITGLELQLPLTGYTIAFVVIMPITYLIAVFMNRLYSYQQVRRRFSEDREHFFMHKPSDEIESQENQTEEQYQQQPNVFQEPTEMQPIASHHELPPKEGTNNVRPNEIKQVELASRYEMSKSMSGGAVQPLDSERRSLALEERRCASSNGDVPELPEAPMPHSISLAEPLKEQPPAVPTEQRPKPKWSQSVLSVLMRISGVLTSVHFNFRLLQLVTIVMIQRYNTLYSLLLILWLVLSSIFTKVHFLRTSTMVLVLPAALFNYVPLYYSNIHESPLPSSCGYFPCSVYGFNPWIGIWVDVIIFNYYIYLILTFLKITTGEILAQLKRKLRQQRRKKLGMRKKTVEVSYWKILLAFVFKYTSLVTLIIMFMLGFSSVNIIHLGFSLLFLVFFALGEQLIVRQVRHGQQTRKIISTFSQKYWIYIVNYTGLVIFAKYIYFLLFPGFNPGWLLLTGVSKTYDTRINFSLSGSCQSNTTYCFLIYIAAALQLEVCRSEIYKEMSIDLTYYVSQKAFFKSKWTTLSKVWELFNILYYQGLFLVSSIVVILLNWRWSVNGVLISLAVVYGVVYGFGKGRLWVLAMWSNLTFIAINYLLMFMSFSYVQSQIGPDAYSKVEYYAQLLGFFKIEDNSLQLTFLNNILIFLFTVQSQQLYRILVSRSLYPNDPQLNTIPDENLSHQLRASTDRSSSKISSVDINHDISRNNARFAQIYLKNVILVTSAYYEKDLAEYKFIRSLQAVLAYIITDLAVLFVIICSLYFRLAITMFVFLIIYLLHFLFQFKEMATVIKSSGFMGLLDAQLKRFQEKIDLLYSDKPEPAYHKDEKFADFQQLIDTNKLRILVLKHNYRRAMWPYAALMSFCCLWLTYSLQIVTQDFCSDTCNYSAYIIQKVMFVVGLSTTNDKTLWRESYFYFFMIFICMTERYLLDFAGREFSRELTVSSKLSSGIRKAPAASLLNIKEEVEDEDNTETKLRRPTPEEHDIFQSTVHTLGQRWLPPPVLRPAYPPPSEQVYRQANLSLFYTFSEAYIKIKSVYGILSILLRFYISLLLINCSQKNNIFSWVYLIIAAVFWVKTIRFEMVESINRISIIILLAQYFLLLLNINPSSQFYVEQYAPYSLIGMWLKSTDWQSYLAFGGVPTNDLRGSSENVSFIINSIIIFATEYYFSLFYLVTRYTLSTFKRLKRRYDYIVQELVRVELAGTKLYLNYEKYKGGSYRFLRKLYETITIYYHIILSLIILLIVLSFTTAVSIGLMILAASYFCLVIFAGRSSSGEDKRVQYYTYYYFYICKVVSFLQLLLLTIFHIPTLVNECVPSNVVLWKVCEQIKIMSITGDLFLLFFVQLWFDMYESEQYQRFLKVYKRSIKFTHQLMTKCYVYRQNDQRLKDMFQQYQDVLNFQQQVNGAMRAIEQWHRIMRKDFDKRELKGQLKQFNRTIKLSVNEADQESHHDATVTQKLFRLCKRMINHTLYQSVPTLVNELKRQNSRVFSEAKVSCHDFVAENFEQLEKQMTEMDTYYTNLYARINECDRQGCQELLRKQIEQLPVTEPNQQSMIMPSLIEIKEQHSSLGILEILLYLLASRFDDMVLFFILMYYMVNPCLASLPIVIMVLSYEVQAELKRKNWLLIYIVLLIAVIQVVQEYYELNSGLVLSPVYGWFFFVSATDQQPFSTGYLEFLLVLVLLNQLLKMWIGLADREPVQIENLYQALVRCQINNSVKQSKESQQQGQEDSQKSVDLAESLHQTKVEIEGSVRSKSTGQIDQKDRNPYEVCLEQLQTNCHLIVDEDASMGFFRKLRQMRDGTDLYPFIATIQVISIIYLIVFYPVMQNTDQSQGVTNLQSNKFSTPLIVSVLFYVGMALVERYIATLPYNRGRKEYIKYTFTMILLFLACLEAYYLAPLDTSSVEVSYSPTPPLLGFMFLQFLYFICSALQVKWGYKKYKRLNSMLHKRTYTNYLITTVYTAIPFLYELKLIMDWSFATTGLTLNNWVLHFNIYLTSFMSLINGKTNEVYKLGKPIPTVSKVLFGWCGFLLIILLIFGPMILFSSLNPISESNLVIGGQLQIGIQILNSNYFGLYSTSHFSQPPIPINQTLFKQLDFQQIPMLESIDSTQLEQQFEQIDYYPYSDNMWSISTPNYKLLLQSINNTLDQMANGIPPDNQFQMTIEYELTRNVSTTVSSPTTFNYPFLNNTQQNTTDNKFTLSYSQLVSLNNTLTKCSSPTNLDQFYVSLIRLETTGNSFKPHPILKNNSNGVPLYLQNVTMTLICNGNTSLYTSSATSMYWEVSLNMGNSNNGLVMYVLCDKYTSLSFGFTFIGLYTGVILVIANFLRGFFTGDISLMPYNQNPRPESILCICQAIEVMRMRKNLREEVLLYYELVDIMRSPEIIKYICGNYSKFIKDNDDKQEALEKAKHHKAD